MRRVSLIIGIVLVMCLMAGPCFAGLNQFAGTWKNVDPNTRGVTTLKIKVRGDSVRIHAWGSCSPKDCDWGRVKAIAFAPNVSSDLSRTAKALTAEFKTNFNNTLLVVKPMRGNMLQVSTFTHFTSGNRTAYSNVFRFKKVTLARPVRPAPAPPVRPAPRPEVTPRPAPRPAPPVSLSISEDCVGFNPRTAKVAKISGRWKIVDGSHWMFDFGNNRSEAVKALKVIKHYGMTKSCFVGRPGPSFKYMRVKNRAPSRSFPGEDCISFNPNTIQVKRINGRWKIVDGSHWMFDFGNKGAEAKKAFAIIKKYRFTRSCFVGRPDPSFEYLRK